MSLEHGTSPQWFSLKTGAAPKDAGDQSESQWLDMVSSWTRFGFYSHVWCRGLRQLLGQMLVTARQIPVLVMTMPSAAPSLTFDHDHVWPLLCGGTGARKQGLITEFSLISRLDDGQASLLAHENILAFCGEDLARGSRWEL